MIVMQKYCTALGMPFRMNGTQTHITPAIPNRPTLNRALGNKNLQNKLQEHFQVLKIWEPPTILQQNKNKHFSANWSKQGVIKGILGKNDT